MAGTQFSGFKNSKATLFKGASMIIVPPVFDDMALLERIKELLEPAGFGRISISTPEKHDEVIAFTSQLAHLVSNAFIKSPAAQTHKGFSAGSYKDLTRVAWLNEEMWMQLFLDTFPHIFQSPGNISDNVKFIDNDGSLFPQSDPLLHRAHGPQ